MKPIQIDPKAIKANIKSTSSAGSPKAAVFSNVLGGVSAMGPATAEFVNQATGGSNLAGAVLNAAFSGIEATRGVSSGGFAGGTGYGPFEASPGVMGSPRYTTIPGYAGTGLRFGGDTVGTKMGLPQTSTGLQSPIDDPSEYQYELMQTMNSNNLKLLELQALMQSNMQSWTTKSNILSADHRARMSMIEKFTARG